MGDTYLEKLQKRFELNVMDIDQAKTEGRKIIGFYCLYSPTELATAAGAIPLPLCGTKNDPIEAAEQELPRNLCPLIKSSYGFAATETCPFFQFSDMVVGDTTCDGKKKMFEIMDKYRPTHVLQLPHHPESEASKTLWRNELDRLKQIIEAETNQILTDDKIQSAIKLLNTEREVKKDLMDLAQEKPSPISGLDMLNILFKTGFFANKKRGIRLIQEIIDEIKENAQKGETPFTEETTRVLLTGVPVGIGSEKVIRIIEESGANVVCFENCSGYKQAFQVAENKNPMEALADQYLKIPCSVMSPNTARLETLSELIESFSVDAVVDLTWQACHTYNIESYTVEKYVKENHNLPFLHLETDYSESDSEQLRVRIEAFLEMDNGK